MGTVPGIEIVRGGSKKPASKQPMVKIVFLGVAQRGPIAKLTQVTGITDFADKFGKAVEDGWLYQAVKNFYDKNGRGEVYVGRIVHYTDPTDQSSKTSASSTVTIQDNSAVDTLAITATSDGVWGDNITVKIEDATLDPTNKFKITVTYRNETETFDELSMVDTSDDYVETKINGKSKFIEVEDLDSTTAAPGDRPVNDTYTLANGDDGIAGIVDADYIGDAVAKTGIYMMDEITTRFYFSIPGNTSRSVIKSCFDYADSNKKCFFVGELPKGLTDAKRADFRNASGDYDGQASITSYNGALYSPWIKGINEATKTQDNLPVSPVVLAVYTDVEYRRGVYKAPAGITDGKIPFANGVEMEVDPEKVYDYGINVIKNFANYGVCIWGSRTPSSDPDWVDIPTPLLFLKIEDWIRTNFMRYVFEPLNDTTFDMVDMQGNEYLMTYYKKGAFDDGGTDDPNEAFFFQCDNSNNTEATKAQKTLVVDWGIRPVGVAEIIRTQSVLYAGTE